MNYYEHHLGDWAAATGHLTWDEDMAYTRLLRAYYKAEAAIQDGQQYRLARASTPAQRKAVDAVLAEFFTLTDGHHHQRRADCEIERFQDKQRKAKASANARWSHTERNANASPDAMRTHSEGNAPRAHSIPQTPDTSLQKEIPPALLVPPAAAGKRQKEVGPEILTAEGVDPKVARDWLLIRKAKKAPLTETAWEGVKREAAAAGMTPAQAVKHAAESNWQGFRAAWLKGPNGAAPIADIFAGAR